MMFLPKTRKCQLEKLENMMEECFSEKKRSEILKSLPYNNGKAENMPVVSGRLVERKLKHVSMG